MKRCTKCGEEKPESEFARCARTRSGLAYWCRECNAVAARARRSTPEGRERERAYQRARRATPETGEFLRAYQRAYRARPEVRERERARRATPEGRKRQRAGEARRRERKLEAVSLGIWRCAGCRRFGSRSRGPDGKPWHIDHAQPLARQGGHNVANGMLLCGPCNLSKSATPLRRWGRRLVGTALSEPAIRHLLEAKIRFLCHGARFGDRWAMSTDQLVGEIMTLLAEDQLPPLAEMMGEVSA